MIEIKTFMLGCYTLYLFVPKLMPYFVDIQNWTIGYVQGVTTITFTSLRLWICKTNQNKFKYNFFQKRLTHTKALCNIGTIFISQTNLRIGRLPIHLIFYHYHVIRCKWYFFLHHFHLSYMKFIYIGRCKQDYF